MNSNQLATSTSKKPILTCKKWFTSLRVQKVFTDVKSARHVVYLGYEQSQTWQLFPHTNPSVDVEDSKVEIYGHDVVTIKHSELDAYLCASVSYQLDSPEIYFRKYQGQHQGELISIHNFWEVLHYELMFQGRPFEIGNRDKIILRHFSTGRLMCLDERDNLILEKIQLEGTQEKQQPVIFSVDPIQLGQTKLFSNQSYKVLKNEKLTQILSHSQEILTLKSMESNVKTAELDKEIMFTPLEDSYFDEKRIVSHE